MWALLAAGGLGLVAGVLAGLFGVGGGILFVPTLTLVLGLTSSTRRRPRCSRSYRPLSPVSGDSAVTATCAGGPR